MTLVLTSAVSRSLLTPFATASRARKTPNEPSLSRDNVATAGSRDIFSPWSCEKVPRTGPGAGEEGLMLSGGCDGERELAAGAGGWWCQAVLIRLARGTAADAEGDRAVARASGY